MRSRQPVNLLDSLGDEGMPMRAFAYNPNGMSRFETERLAECRLPARGSCSRQFPEMAF
jgi:hypothetical protein